jgi:transcription initiation factor TFIIB
MSQNNPISKTGVDLARVDGPENPFLGGGNLSTLIGSGTGAASFDAFGNNCKQYAY